MATPTQQIIKKAKSLWWLDSNILIPTQWASQWVAQSVSSPDYTKLWSNWVTKWQPLDTGLVWVTPKADTTPVQTTDQINQDQAKNIFANKYKDQWVMTDEANTALNAWLTTEKTLEQKAQDAKNAAQDAQLQSDLLWASKIVSQAEQQKQYATWQEWIRKQTEQLNIQNAEIASSQRIQQAKQQVNNLKQNIAYIWQWGRPSKSMVAMDAVTNQVNNADKTFRELIQVEDNLKTIQKLWVEYNAKAFEQKMVELQDRLDDQVNSTLQSTISSFLDESGEIDTMDELVALKEKWLDATDNSIEWLTNRNLQERQRIMEEYDSLVKEKKDVIKNANTVNEEMSSAMWYYVDGNGNPLVTASWATIPHAKDAPIEPIFDKETGKMITFSLDEKGQIVSKIDQVIPQEVFSAETISNIIQSVKNGTLTPEQAISLVPKSAKESLLQQMGSIVLPKEAPTSKWWSKLSDWSLYNQDTWEVRNVNWSTSNTTVQTNPQSIVDFSINKRGRTNLQCGELVNDYLFKITGKDPSWAWRLGNTYNSKITALTNIWLSDWPVEWWLFVSNPLNNNIWHTGIVQSVNADWSITVLEANASGKANGEAPATKTYTNTSWMTFSQAPQATVPLTKEEKSTLFSIQDDLKADPRRKEYLTLNSKIKTLEWIKTRLDTWKATAQDKQQLISDFAKVLDPTSVVRTEEYALAAKYGQSAINKTIQEISNWYDTNWPLSDTSAKVLAEAVWLRYEATKLSNDEAVEEQKKRAEIFLWRPVSYDELAVTKSQAPVQTPQQSNIPASLANPWVIQWWSVNDPLWLR